MIWGFLLLRIQANTEIEKEDFRLTRGHGLSPHIIPFSIPFSSFVEHFGPCVPVLNALRRLIEKSIQNDVVVGEQG